MFWRKKETPPPPVAEIKDPPVCEDCKWFKAYEHVLTCSRCAHPKAGGARDIALVTRSPCLEDLPFCTVARLDRQPCGKGGQLFEPKPAPPEKPKPDPYRGVLDNIDCTLLRIARTLEQPAKKRRR